MDILWLSEDEVRSVLNMEDAIKAVEIAFRDHGLGKTQMPPKPYIYFSRYGGDLRTMPAYLEGPDLAGVKIVNVHAGNLSYGLPTVMAILVLNSPQTGAPLAIMGATYLTAMRTGAAGALAAKLLARPESNVVGIVGAGVQGKTQLLGISKFFQIVRVIISDISQDRVMAFEEDISKSIDCEFVRTTNPMKACDCDILVTATPSRSPVIKESWIKPGTHINAIGADAKGKQELESSLTKKAKVVVDDLTQAVHSGEVNMPISEGILRPEEIYAQIGELVVGKKLGRGNNQEITIFDSTGLAIQDISTGWMIYQRMLETNMGKRMKFF